MHSDLLPITQICIINACLLKELQHFAEHCAHFCYMINAHALLFVCNYIIHSFIFENTRIPVHNTKATTSAPTENYATQHNRLAIISLIRRKLRAAYNHRQCLAFCGWTGGGRSGNRANYLMVGGGVLDNVRLLQFKLQLFEPDWIEYNSVAPYLVYLFKLHASVIFVANIMFGALVEGTFSY